MMPFSATRPQEHAVIYSDLEPPFGISVAVKTTTNWAKIIWWDGTTEIKEPTGVGLSSTLGKICFFKISDVEGSKRMVVYSTDSSGNKSGTIQMFTCYRQRDKRKATVGNPNYLENYSENQKVTKMDVSTCSDLRVLKCDRNKLTSLGDITACRFLETIACAGNCFGNINLSRMQNLDQLYCNFNPTLNTLTSNFGLRRLGASSTGLSEVPTGSFVQVNMRDCNNIITLDLDARYTLLYANFRGCANMTDAYLTDCTNLHNVNLGNTPSLSIVSFTSSGFTGGGITYFGTKSYNYDAAYSKFKSIFIKDNNTMTSTDVENMYATLPLVDLGYLYATNNAGAAAADSTDAVNQGWTVYT